MRLIEIPDDGILRIPIIDSNVTVGQRCFDLSELPTIDAVPVVRCRDCKHWTVDGLGHPWCDMWEDYQYHEDVFCSYGERKENNND